MIYYISYHIWQNYPGYMAHDLLYFLPYLAELSRLHGHMIYYISYHIWQNYPGYMDMIYYVSYHIWQNYPGYMGT